MSEINEARPYIILNAADENYEKARNNLQDQVVAAKRRGYVVTGGISEVPVETVNDGTKTTVTKISLSQAMVLREEE